VPFGDLGPYLGEEIRKEAEKRGFQIFDSSEGIRATVIGASQYTVQLSGETIHVPEAAKLPVRNLRVFTVHVDWEYPIAACSAMAVIKALDERDAEVRGAPFALAFSSPPFIGYGTVQELARGIDQALASLAEEDSRTLWCLNRTWAGSSAAYFQRNGTFPALTRSIYPNWTLLM
jgi:ethanolamine utilization protein EutA